MPPAKLRAIIFDIGRVLVRIDVARALDGLAGTASQDPKEIWSALEKDPRWRDWQEGRISPHDWHRHLSRRLGGNLTFEQFREVWNRVLAPEPILDDDLLADLSKRFRLAVLSNTDPLHVAHMEAHHQFLSHFPHRIYSCRLGASKPDPLIYKEALRACGVRAQEALYIDDIPAFVEAAVRLGIGGIVFKSPGQLTADLRFLGVLPATG